MADSSHVTEVAPVIHKVVLSQGSTDIRIEADVPSPMAVLSLVAVTGRGPQVLASASRSTAGKKLVVKAARNAVPEESRMGSSEQAFLLDSSDISQPGLYLLLGAGQADAEKLVAGAWSRASSTSHGRPPVGATLSVEGASLMRDGVQWPMNTLTPDCFWAISNSSPALLTVCIFTPGPNPDSDDAVFLCRRGTSMEVAAPTWISAPGAMLMGVMSLPGLASETASNVVVRRFLAGDNVSCACEITSLSSGTPVTMDLPSNMSVGGITFGRIQAAWRDDYSLALTPLEPSP